MKTVVATMTGMPQLATRTMLIRVLSQPETFCSSRASSMPITMVRTTAPPAKTIVRITTVQNSSSPSTAVKLSKPTFSAGWKPHSWDWPNFWKDRVTSRSSG
ncbi:hypothetical protein GCM10020256_23990 [Streptomyces thermocoprophilus]